MIRRGAAAGVATVVVFTAVHHLLISDIWAMLPVMALLGAGLGAALGWSHRCLVPVPGPTTWFAHAGAYLAALGALGTASLVLFEPVVTFAAISRAGGPVDELVVRALPLSVAWVALVVVTGCAVQLRTAGRRGPVLLPHLTTASLVLLTLGLNMSVLGLVEDAGSGVRPSALFVGLVVLMVVVHAVAVAHLEHLAGRRGRAWA